MTMLDNFYEEFVLIGQFLFGFGLLCIMAKHLHFGL